ncbi:MAG: MbnP family protein [Candidatus Kapaibacteriota bacterium]
MGCSENPSHSIHDDHGSVKVQLQHLFDSMPFAFNTEHVLPNGEKIRSTMLKYYVSNISFEKADGSLHIIPQDESYFLVDESMSTTKLLSLDHIPAGTYTAIRFTIGVDSLRSTMGLDKRKGILDIGAAAQDMYWSWNSGYIHLKFEGTFSAPKASGDIRYHVGGFGGYSSPTINAIRTIRLALGNNPLVITGGAQKTLTVSADLKKMFTGPIPFSVAENASVMFSPFCVTIADNYATMFSIVQ